jgi:hypothetical protein
LRIPRAPFLRHSALSEHSCDPCNPWLILFNPLTLQRFNSGEGIRLLKREHDVRGRRRVDGRAEGGASESTRRAGTPSGGRAGRKAEREIANQKRREAFHPLPALILKQLISSSEP